MTSYSPTNTITSTISTNPFFSFSPKTCQLSTTKKRNQPFNIAMVTCTKASNDNSDDFYQNPTTRRHVLIGLGGLYGGITLANDSSASSAFPLVLDKKISIDVSRPKKSRSKKEKEDDEEILVIDSIELNMNSAVKFDVYVNDEDESGPGKSEFAGSFVNVPHRHKHSGKQKTCLRLGLNDLLQDLEAESDDSVIVTLVPKYGVGLATIGGIKIDFLRD